MTAAVVSFWPSDLLPAPIPVIGDGVFHRFSLDDVSFVSAGEARAGDAD